MLRPQLQKESDTMDSRMNRMSRMVTFVLAALAAGAVIAAEAPKAGPAAAIVLPPPKVDLPPLPADGSGI